MRLQHGTGLAANFCSVGHGGLCARISDLQCLDAGQPRYGKAWQHSSLTEATPALEAGFSCSHLARQAPISQKRAREDIRIGAGEPRHLVLACEKVRARPTLPHRAAWTANLEAGVASRKYRKNHPASMRSAYAKVEDGLCEEQEVPTLYKDHVRRSRNERRVARQFQF